MTEHREHMTAALKETFVPMLRQKGFVGSFPHFRRQLDNRIDFLNVQFAREGGRFCLNIGQTGPKGLQDPAWPGLAIAETTVGHLRHRSRVHRGFFLKQWFDFGPRSYDPPKSAKAPSYYEAIAAEAVRAFEKDGEKWFGKSRALP
jgi:hypothetical protein